MSGSETGVITNSGRDGAFSVGGLPKQPLITNMRLAYSADGQAVYKPVITPVPSPGGGGEGSNGGNGIMQQPPAQHSQGININFGTEQFKRKRGRPRKYGGPDGGMALALVPSPPAVSVSQSPGAAGFPSPPLAPAAAAAPTAAPTQVTPAAPAAALPLPFLASVGGGVGGGEGSVSPNSVKKVRGRPPGSSKRKQLDALGSAGLGFTPHVITVKSGEDVSSKIMSFSQHGPRAVCILSANGAISNVTLRQPATSGGTVTYEGRFEILSLSGSFMLTENGGQRSRTGGLSVSLSGPDGRVVGGGVAGLLTAASPVQVVVGSFISDGRKVSKSANQVDPLSVASRLAPAVGSTGASSPPSRGTLSLSESSGGPGSPLNQSTGNNSNPQGISSMPWK